MMEKHWRLSTKTQLGKRQTLWHYSVWQGDHKWQLCADHLKRGREFERDKGGRVRGKDWRKEKEGQMR